MNDITIGLEGYIEAVVRRSDGSEKSRHQAKNTIDANLVEEVAYYLFKGTNIVSVDRMNIGYTQGTFSPAAGSATISSPSSTDDFQAIFTETFTCLTVTSGTQALIQSVKLAKTGSPITEYASHTFGQAIDGIQATETVTIAYTLRAGTGTGVSTYLRESVSSTFGSSGTARRAQFLWVNGYGTALASVTGAPDMTGTDSDGNQSGDGNSPLENTATKSGGSIVIRNNTSAGAGDDSLPAMSSNATKAWLSHDSGSAPGADSQSMGYADLTNVNSGDKLDLQFTLTVATS